MTRWRTALLPLALLGALAAGQGTADPLLQIAVEQFFATQQSEDVEAYLALWSAGADRPGREQLEYVFRSGDDVFSGIAIVKVQPYRGRLRVRVTARRARTDPAGRTRRLDMTVSLTYAKEGNDWKLWRDADDRIHARIDGGAFGMDLLATPPGPPVLQGDQGFSRKGPLPAQASWYYSQPQLAVAGTIRGPGNARSRTAKVG